MITTKKEFKTIDEYISVFPKEIQSRLEELRKVIEETAPDAVEAISYQMPTFKLNGHNLVHFAAFKNHIGFYPFPSGIEAFKEESMDFGTSTGTIQFPHNKPLPLDLVIKMVKFRIEENSTKKKKGTY